MLFRVLGPLEVTSGDDTVDRTVDLGGPKPRALLATLLVEPGAVVSVDRLVEAVWGDQQPGAPAVALRTYISRLRTALASGGAAERLRFQAGGYVLDVAAGELDATEFTRMVGEAKGLASTGDQNAALRSLDAALDLWRGDPLAEFTDIDSVRDEATRLADLRLVATEQRAELLIGMGRGADAVAELDVLLRRHPEREQLAVLLMRALYLSGRQADGLAVYRNLRRRLVAELGIEPSEPVQEVHRQMLARDTALIPVVAANRPTSVRRHRSSFVGRDAELRRVAAALRAAPLVTLTGVGGVGKSRLAMELAEQERPRFPDGVWLCELAPLADGGPVSHAVAATLGVMQRPGLTIEETLFEYLAGRTLLLVVDNCEHVLDEAAQLLDGITRGCPAVTLLATSREPLNIEGEQLWPVPPLPLDEATTLFVHRARAAFPAFEPDPQAGAVAEICRGLDGLPLAIELAAARMRMMSATEIARRLGDSRLLSGGPRGVLPRHQSLAATIGWSYNQLTDREQRLFARLSVFAGGADLAGIHGVCAEPSDTEADTLELVTALVDKSMVSITAGMRYRVLETLRAYGRERLADSGGAAELADRHAAHYAELCHQVGRGVHTADERAWVERIDSEPDNLRAAFEWSIAARDVDAVLRIATLEVAQLWGSYEASTWAQRALDLVPVDHPRFPACVGTAARGAWARGDFARARRIAAMAGGKACERGENRSGHPGDVLADVAMYEGDVEHALRHYIEQARLAHAADDPIRLTWTLYYVAICHAVGRQPAAGVPAATECVAVAETTTNPSAMAMARYALGLVLKKAEPERALALFDAAAELAAGVRNLWFYGIALMEAAATRSVHGDMAAAAADCLRVLDHWDRIGDLTQQWLHLRYVMRLLVRLGADDDAAALHHCLVAAGKQSALDTYRLDALLDGDRVVAAKARGSVLSLAGAVELARKALAVERSSDDPGT